MSWFQNKEDYRTQKNIDWVCEILDRNDIEVLDTPWKVEQLGEIQWTLKRKNKQYSDQLWGNERWLNDESVNWRQWCSKKDNQWTSTFRSYWGQCRSKIVHALVNSVSNGETKMYLKDSFISSSFKTWLVIDEDTRMNVIEWWKDAHHQDWLWNKAALERQSHMVILWNMVIDRCYHTTALNECRKGHPPRRLTMGKFILKPNVHFTAWVWVIKATSLMRPRHFFSQSD